MERRPNEPSTCQAIWTASTPSMKRWSSSRTPPCLRWSSILSPRLRTKPSRRRKKRSVKGNGTEVVTVRTRHGAFSLRRCRLRDTQSGQEVALWETLVSEPLRRRCLFWVNRLSFADVARLVQEQCGTALVSEDGVWRWVQEEAACLDAQQARSIAERRASSEPSYTAASDLYC